MVVVVADEVCKRRGPSRFYKNVDTLNFNSKLNVNELRSINEPPMANYGSTTASKTEFPSTYRDALIYELGVC